MLATSFKRTKIVATIGPASSSPEILEQLMLAGVNAFRLNFSHGTHAEHETVLRHARSLSAKHDRPVAVIVDLQGPKIRVGTLPSDGLPFVRDNLVRFQFGASYDTSGVIPLQHDIAPYLKKGERIFLRDGMIQVEVVKLQKNLITGRVLTPGLLYSNQGINLPDTDLGGDILTPKDVTDIAFAVKHQADYVALSFVQTAHDIHNLKDRLAKAHSDLRIIAKIETAAAVAHLEEIVIASDALMVARGDLAVETLPEAVPTVQRRMIALARRHRKTVIVATQMLESMVQAPQPTRAEVSDVATAVMEGTDAVMLSAETAMGLFPVDTVRMMKRIVLYAEREDNRPPASSLLDFANGGRTNAVSAAAVLLARQLPAKIIIAETSSGQTARNISALRPNVPIIMVTDHERVYYQMAIVWGGKSYLLKSMKDAADHILQQLKTAGHVNSGDAAVVASGNQPGLIGGTDRVQVKVAA